MNQRFSIDFCFKGSRTYVHGTDIYNNLISVLEENGFDAIEAVDLTFHGISRNNLDFTLGSEKAENTEGLQVAMNFISNEKKYFLQGYDNHTAVECRYDYAEERIQECSQVDTQGHKITLQRPSPFTPIETIVAMNKVLLETLFNDESGKWYFTRLQLKKQLPENSEVSMQITLKSNFQFKLTKSEIIDAQGKVLGYIYFSLVR